MKYFAVALFALCLSSAIAGQPDSVEIRFCPASAVRTYPLETQRDLQSLLLQNVAIINHGQAAFDAKEIELELLQAGHAPRTKTPETRAVHPPAPPRATAQAGGGF